MANKKVNKSYYKIIKMGINPLTRVKSINYPILFFLNNNSYIVIKTIKFYLFWIIALFLYIPNIFYFLLNEYKKYCFKNFNEINISPFR